MSELRTRNHPKRNPTVRFFHKSRSTAITSKRKGKGNHTYTRYFPILCLACFSYLYISIPNTSYKSLEHKTKKPSGAKNAIFSNVLDEVLQNTEQSESIRIAFENLKNYNTSENHRHGALIDSYNEEERRCKRYGWTFDPLIKRRRRIFFGSNIADDSWHAIVAHAMESYGLYHTLAFVESNTTTADRDAFMLQRELNYAKGSLNLKALQSGIFGPTSQVFVDLYIDNPEERKDENGNIHMIQEHMQREVALRRWKENGMTPNDVAIFSDLDEVFTRDFLLAISSCDVPEFRPGQDCKEPKLTANSLIFESSPECIYSDKKWNHPDLIIGECVHGIGNSTLHKPGKRRVGENGKRKEGYGTDPYDYKKMPGISMYPLWKAVDFRTAWGLKETKNFKTKKQTAYHIRNFFLTAKSLRNKYATCTHARKDAWTAPLQEMQKDLNLTVQCIKGLEHPRLLEGGFDSIEGDIPMIFQDAEYRKARHHELQKIIQEDEALLQEKKLETKI